MRIRKIVLLTLLLILASISCLYAGGANEGNLYYFPRSVVDNRNLMIELAGQYELTVNDINADFENTSPNQLAFFRIRDSLKSNVSVGNANNTNVTMKITSLDNWEFVHETNTTSTRPFSLSAFCTELVDNNRVYSNRAPIELTLGNEISLSGGSSVKFKEEGGDYYLTFPTTSFNRHELSLYAQYIRDFDFCVVLPEVQPGTYLESGYYTTRLKVTTTTFVQSEEVTRWVLLVPYKDHQESEGELPSFTITLRGYVGITPEMSEEPFFIVSSTDYTYNMDLAPEEQERYHIANLSFTNSRLSTTNPSRASDSEKGGKYKIYVSPTRDYQAPGKYYFIKMGTENEARTPEKTIYYDLYTSASGNTIITSGSSSVNSDPYPFSPEFTSPQISSSGVAGGQDIWKYTWNLDQDIYLQVLDPTTQRLPGLYYSYIYFTLVSY